MIYCTKLFVHFHCINPKPQASSVVKTTAMDLVLTAQMTAAPLTKVCNILSTFLTHYMQQIPFLKKTNQFDLKWECFK